MEDKRPDTQTAPEWRNSTTHRQNFQPSIEADREAADMVAKLTELGDELRRLGAMTPALEALLADAVRLASDLRLVAPGGGRDDGGEWRNPCVTSEDRYNPAAYRAGMEDALGGRPMRIAAEASSWSQADYRDGYADGLGPEPDDDGGDHE